ncbi:MAG TPA: LuxR C-terminal-related transcriptional regulator [Rugosimonospora sp.]|nr:LuxR C-terminal-related transcriptional regulator [Rugosimonospora sp.]
MLREPEAGIAALAASLGWTEAEVDAALDELGRLSLLRPSWEDPGVMRPVAPAVGLENLLIRQQAELYRQQHQIEESRAALQALVAEFPGAGRESSAAIEELVGLDAVREGLERLALQTRYEVLAFAPDGAQTAESMRASTPLNRHLLEKGVTMRTLYLNSARNDPQTTAHAQWLTEMGAELRTVPVLPIRMLVVDRTWAVLPLDPERTAAGACVVRSPGAIAAVCALFDQVWAAGTPWGSRSGQTSVTLSEQERALLHLLLQGDTDEQAGRKLGVSTRTVGRIAADLMARLKARSRFQAGAYAATRGWLAPAAVATPPPP